MELRNQTAFALGASLDGPAAQNRQEKRLREASDGFEALFLQQMLKSARSASLGDGLLESSGTEKVQQMLDQSFAESSAGRSGFGLSEAIYRQFSGHIGGKG